MKSPLRAIISAVAVAAVSLGLVVATGGAANAAQNPSPGCRALESIFSDTKCAIEVSNPTITSAAFGQPVHPGFSWTRSPNGEGTPIHLIDTDAGVTLEVDWGDGTAHTVIDRMAVSGSVSPDGGYCRRVGNLTSCSWLKHAYAVPGSYTVTYTARLHLEPAGVGYYIEHSAQTTAVISSTPPQVQWIEKPPLSAHVGEEITARWSVGSVDPGKPYTTIIDWGDGTVDNLASLENRPRQFSQSHVYTRPGEFRPFVRAFPTGTSNLDVTQAESVVSVTLSGSAIPGIRLADPLGPACGPLEFCFGDNREIRPGEVPVQVSGVITTAALGDLGYAEIAGAVIDWGDGTVDRVDGPCGAQQTWCVKGGQMSQLPVFVESSTVTFAFQHDYADRIPREVILTVTDEFGSVGATILEATATVASQTITMTELIAQTFPGTDPTLDASQQLDAVASSGLPVAYTAYGPCSIVDGETVAVDGAGTCSVIAQQAGDAYFAPAEAVIRSFDIAKAPQQIYFEGLPFGAYYGRDYGLFAIGGQNVPIFLSAEGPCVIVGPNVMRPTGTGLCTLTATSPGDEDYLAAEPVRRTVQIAKAAQSIDFDVATSATFGDADSQLQATATSGLTVSFSATGACSVEGAALRFDRGGDCTVTAAQGGDDNHQSAVSVSHTIAVAKAAQTIDFDEPGEALVGADVQLIASASSGMPVEFTASGSCTVTGSTVRTNAAGVCTVTAAQPGDDRYLPAPVVSHDLIGISQTTVALDVAPASGKRGAALPAKVQARVGGTPDVVIGGTVTFLLAGVEVATSRVESGVAKAVIAQRNLPSGTVALVAVYTPANGGEPVRSEAVLVSVK